ncbi:uncharacterized protein At2g29880-like [Prosopis cineraria]|uniref:uncharacterized protein At2g29880-like n=1 Tax=Prosopis cineraria TaxID=364024 RepID=UPI002410ABD4|nr:uncharacterized protein At2g29880-like [Prosopis cineraria]
MSKEKALGTTEETKLFLKLALQQVKKNKRKGSTLSKEGWEALMQQFNALNSRSYDKKQLKNKWDNLRKDWNIWDKLLNKETGLGWDGLKNTISAPDEWWSQKIKENPEYRKFRHRPLPYVQELTQLFQLVVARGTYLWTPVADDAQDVYRPQLDLTEGLGDSDDVRNISGGALPEIGQVNLNNAYSGGSNSRSKRKIGESGQNNKGKHLATVMVDSMSRLVFTQEDRVSTLKSILNSIEGGTKLVDQNVVDVAKELYGIEEIAYDESLLGQCAVALLDKTARDMYIGLRDNRRALVAYLRCLGKKSRLDQS